MTLRDAAFAFMVAVLALSGVAGIAASDSLADVGAAVSAQYIGFEDLARRVDAPEHHTCIGGALIGNAMSRSMHVIRLAVWK